MILYLFLPLELLLSPGHNLKSYSAILLFQATKSHNFSVIRNLRRFFFLYSCVQGPTTQVGPIGLRHFEFKPLHLPYLGVTTKSRTSFFGRGGAHSTSARECTSVRRPPRPSWRHQHLPIIDGGKWPSRTRRRDSRRSWYYGTVHSTSDFLARPHWHRTKSEPSLFVGFGHVSCSMVASLR